MSTDFAYNWAIKRRSANMLVAKEFSKWYGKNDTTHESLAEAWTLFEMNSWRIQ